MFSFFKIFSRIVLVSIFLSILSFSVSAREQSPSSAKNTKGRKDYEEYLVFFEKVYKTMEENYFNAVHRKDYDKFIKVFDEKIYKQLRKEGKSIDYIRWRSAAYLVDYLKSPDDIFSKFFPPKPAETFQREVLGQRVDLGIDGELTANGFLVKHVEPRSDAYGQGLRIDDILLAIDGTEVKTLTQEQVVDQLTPLVDTHVKLSFLASEQKLVKEMEVVSKEYFKQTVFMEPVSLPGVYCLKIERFNRMTSDDLFRHLQFIRQSDPNLKGLIIDLRGNPGGPPLAAREISAFFLTPGEDFAYFQKKGFAPSTLDVPSIPEAYHYNGPMAILVNKDSGSASELFSGVLQHRKRAVLMGTNTAGQVFLKSPFHFEDESMLLLVTSRGYYPDGSTFSFDGVVPDHTVSEEKEVNLVNMAAVFLLKVGSQSSGNRGI